MKRRSLIVWLVIVIIILLGIGTAFIAEEIPETSVRWKIILNRISTAILVAGLLGFLNRLLLEDNLIRIILQKVNLKRDVDEAGLLRVFTNIADIEYKSLFADCNKVDIVHVYGRTWTSNNEDSIVEVLARGGKINVYLCDPSSPAISVLSMMYDMPEEKVRNRINSIIDEWKSINQKVKGNRRKNLQVHLSHMVPSYSMYKFDDKAVIILNRLSKAERTKKINGYLCTSNQHDTTLFKNHCRDLENLSQNSEKRTL